MIFSEMMGIKKKAAGRVRFALPAAQTSTWC
jgi:hypothetical protein